MGLLDFLFGSKTPRNVEAVCDRVWMTAEAKFAGMAKEVDERLKSGTLAIILVGHFPDVVARLDEIAGEQTSRVPVKAVPAGNLDAGLAAGLHADESAVIDVIAGERHPLRPVDDRLVAFAGTLPCRCRLVYHVSLEDPVMGIFANDWLKNILNQLGMEENEVIESQLVSRQIKRAQQKLEAQALGNLQADSAGEWLEKNCRR